MLSLIGLGIASEKDMSVRGLEACKDADNIFIELYTCPLEIDISGLSKMCGKDIETLDRKGVEESGRIIKAAEQGNAVLLVGGDPLSATTHYELVLDARKKGIKVDMIHSSSIFSAIAEAGLSLYKFGKTVSLPKPQDNYFPTSPYNNIHDNMEKGMHTLLLLDIGMSASEGAGLLLELEKKVGKGMFKEDSMVVGCAHIGNESMIRYGTIKDIIGTDFGKHPHCILIPSKLSFSEEEFLESLDKM